MQKGNTAIGRRHFLANTLLAALPRGLKAQGQPMFPFPTDPRERLAVSSYPFRDLIRSAQTDAKSKGTLTLADFAKSIPARFKVNGIEPWSRHFDSTDPVYLHTLKAAFTAAGVRVVNIPVDVKVRLCESDPEARDKGLSEYRKWVDAAVLLGAPGIRVHVPMQSNGQTDIQCAVETLTTIVRYGETKDVVIHLENDNPRTEDPFSILDILQAVPTPWLRTLPDFCNTMLIGGDAAYNKRGLEAMFPKAYAISHVKDSESDHGRTYTVDVPSVFAIAKKSEYKGFFSMEWEGEGDPYVGTTSLIRQSLKALTT